MPDLNLIDENEMDESTPQPEEHTAPKKSGGPSMKTHITILVLLSVLCAAGYFMWKKGIFPFKKKVAPIVTQMQEEFPQDQYQQQAVDQPVNQQAMSDSADVALLETPLPDENAAAKKPDTGEAAPPVEEKAGPAKAEDPKAVKEKKDAAAVEPAASESVSTKGGAFKLSDMKGGFTVKVVTYREKKTAVEMAKHLSDNSGYPAFIQKALMKGGDWWSVCIGKYPTKQDAAKAIPTFGEQLRASSVVTRVIE